MSNQYKSDSDNAIVYYNKGKYAGKLGQYEKTIEDFSKSIDINSWDAPAAYHSRGVIWEELGEDDRAEEDYARA